MAKNKKKLKMPNPSSAKVYSPQFEKLQRESKRLENRKPLFKMKRRTKIKIKAWIAAVALAASGIQVARTAFAQSFDENDKSDKTFTIGLVNDGAEIIDDGQQHLIDPNSIVILSENDAFAFDESGNIHRGSIDVSDVTELLTLTEDEIADYNIYQVVAENGVNVRSTEAIEDNNIVSTVDYQDYVLGSSSDGEWISTLSINGNNLCEGYIREDLIKEIGDFNLIYDNVNEILMKVDTSRDGNIPLNLRSQPGQLDKKYIMTTIKNGSIVRLLDQTISEDNRSWSHIEYKSKGGTPIQGWVASDYLISHLSQEPIQNPSKEVQSVEENTISINTNATGNVTGIDISSLSPNSLREVLQTGIPRAVSSEFGNVDTSQLAGDINFVYIKLGASPYGNGHFAPVDYDSYKELVQICEEFGIPYGFYYYSTSTTVEEANIELEHINQKINDLRSTIDMKHNKLDMVIDVELAGTNDRQYQGDIQQHTESKATLINGIQELGISDNVLIYGPMRVMKPDLDQIFSLSDLHSMLSNPDNVNLWLCAPVNESGQLPSDFQNQVAYVKEHGFDTVMTQVVLDADVIGRIDINNMNIEHYQKLIQQEKEITQFDEYDDER